MGSTNALDRLALYQSPFCCCLMDWISHSVFAISNLYFLCSFFNWHCLPSLYWIQMAYPHAKKGWYLKEEVLLSTVFLVGAIWHNSSFQPMFHLVARGLSLTQRSMHFYFYTSFILGDVLAWFSPDTYSKWSGWLLFDMSLNSLRFIHTCIVLVQQYRPNTACSVEKWHLLM